MNGPAIILMYHRVGSVVPDPHELQVSPENFEEQIRCLRDLLDVVPLEAMLEPAHSARAAVTFDDGYVDNLTNAKPILEQLGVPATTFVTSGMVGNTDGFWWDRLATLMLCDDLAVRHLVVEVRGEQLTMDLGSAIARGRAHRFLHRRLLRLRVDEIEAVIAAVSAALCRVPIVSSTSLPVSQAELLRLAEGSTMAIGSHTVSHPRLSNLDEGAQQRELEQSRRDLEATLNRPICLFAYPFGDRESLDSVTVRLAEANYDLALTTTAGNVESSPGPHELRRRAVGDWGAEEFRVRATRWLDG